MRICVVGAGLAGSLLAWRLARTAACRIDVVRGPYAGATTASGGAVRAYEADAIQRALAARSMAELLASPVLRRWADYRSTGAIYLRGNTATVADEVADINAVLPDSATLLSISELATHGLANVPADSVAVVERLAGYVAPAKLRDAVLADAAGSRRAAVLTETVGVITAGAGGTIGCRVGTELRTYDVAVLATGAWTAAILRTSGLPERGYRTKAIQYCVHSAGQWRPPQFVDDVTGLYARPTTDGGLLLGVPTNQWDVDPRRPLERPDLPPIAVRLAAERFPRLSLGPALRRVTAADCYTDEPGLALRPVTSTAPLYTFTGGSGGSVKTALAASERAAAQLLNGR
jgi:glycine/D-amino acid oxidase-like deaminating enzyme